MQDSGVQYSCLWQKLSSDGWIKNNSEGKMKTSKESTVTKNLVSFKATIFLQTPSAVIFKNSSEKMLFCLRFTWPRFPVNVCFASYRKLFKLNSNK